MYVCMYVCMYVYMYVYIYIYICIRDREAYLTTQNTTTTCVPSFFRPRSGETSEVVVRRALELYVQ